MQDNSENNQISSDSEESSSNAEEFFVEQINLEQFNNFIEQLEQGLINTEQIDNMLQELNNNQIKAFFTQLTDNQFDKFIEKLNQEQMKVLAPQIEEKKINREIQQELLQLQGLLQFKPTQGPLRIAEEAQQYDSEDNENNLYNFLPDKCVVIYEDHFEIVNGQYGQDDLKTKFADAKYIINVFNKRYNIWDLEYIDLDLIINHTQPYSCYISSLLFSPIIDNTIVDIREKKQDFLNQLEDLNQKLLQMRDPIFTSIYVNKQAINILNEDEDSLKQQEIIANQEVNRQRLQHFKQLLNPEIEQEEVIQRPIQKIKDFSCLKGFVQQSKFFPRIFNIIIPKEAIDNLPEDNFIRLWTTINKDILNKDDQFVFGSELENDGTVRTPLLLSNTLDNNDLLFNKSDQFNSIELMSLLNDAFIKFLENKLEIDLSDINVKGDISKQCMEKVIANHFSEGQHLDDLTDEELVKLLKRNQIIINIIPNIKDNKQVIDFQDMITNIILNKQFKVLEGQNLDDLTDEELAKLLKRNQIIINIIPKIKDNKQVIDFQDKIINIILNKQLDSQPLANIKLKLNQLLPNLSNTELDIILMNKLFDKIAIQNINIDVLINDLTNLKNLFPELSSDEALYKQYCINANILIKTIFKQKQFEQELLNLNFDSLKQIHNILPEANYVSIFDTVKQSPLFEKNLSNLDFSYLERFFSIVADPIANLFNTFYKTILNLS